MSVIFYPIKPKFAQKIISGEKKYEYRRVKPAKEIKYIVIYSSSPEQLILGIASVSHVLTDTPRKIWKETSLTSGISKSEYQSYFSGADVACAIGIDVVYKLEIPLNPKQIFDDFTVPQSFKYLDESSFSHLKSRVNCEFVT